MNKYQFKEYMNHILSAIEALPEFSNLKKQIGHESRNQIRLALIRSTRLPVLGRNPPHNKPADTTSSLKKLIAPSPLRKSYLSGCRNKPNFSFQNHPRSF